MIARALFASLLLLGASVSATETSPDRIVLVDLTDEFDTIWNRDQALPDAERLSAFKADFAKLIPGFFSAQRVGVEETRYDAHLLSGLKSYPKQRDGIAEASRRFSALLQPARQSFEAEFGRFAEPQTVYLIHSLGEMDGGTRSLPHGNFLIFGADVIARLHLAHDIQPFFHHELFHVYHGQSFESCDEIWCGLWSEGLATYAAASMNPGATDAELLLEVPEPIRAAVDANRNEAVCAVRSRLDSTDGDDGRALFSFNRMNAKLPPRFGYYIGYLAAAEAGRDRSLKELAVMPASEVRPLLEASLAKLESC